MCREEVEKEASVVDRRSRGDFPHYKYLNGTKP